MYSAEICSAPDILRLAAELGREGLQSAFHSPHWLGPLFEVLAPAAGAEVIGVVVRTRDGGAIAGVLPLAVTRENGLKTVRFADFGVTDYASPLLGPAAPANLPGAVAFWTAVRVALAGHHLVRFERLTPAIGDVPNPFAVLPSARRSRMSGHVIVMPDSVKAYVAALGRKTRKEVERCQRHIAEAGPLRAERANAGADAAAAFARLEALQAARWAGADDRYRIGRPEFARFYRAVLDRGTEEGFCDVVTLFAGDAVVGAVFGISTTDRFTVLRIATDDAKWGRFSPGRITLLAAMQLFVDRGIRTFDLGIGDYAFKRRLGATPVPLADLTAALSWMGEPAASALRLKAFVRRQPALMRLADRVRGRAAE